VATFGYGPKKVVKTGKRDLRPVDPGLKIGGGDAYRPIIGKPISEIKPIPGPEPIKGEKPVEKPIKSMPITGKPLEQINPMPGKPSPMPPGKPIRPIRPKPNPIDIIKKRFNDPNGFYNNPKY